MFSTWNLDHVIERSRSVVPALVDAILESDGRPLNVEYFHNLLVGSASRLEKSLPYFTKYL